VLEARIRAVPSGRYAVMLFCEQCAAGPLGSLIGDPQVVLRVR